MQIKSRAADDLEHVAGRGLIFERLLEVASALLQFAEQSGVLHGYDSLGGKALQQGNFFVSEGLHLAAEGSNIAE
jgi:hypothetical protein